ncbi:MAG: hypothetical protein AAFX76_01885 [Planctomycetota bacterium]
MLTVLLGVLVGASGCRSDITGLEFYEPYTNRSLTLDRPAALSDSVYPSRGFPSGTRQLVVWQDRFTGDARFQRIPAGTGYRIQRIWHYPPSIPPAIGSMYVVELYIKGVEETVVASPSDLEIPFPP